MSDDGCAHQFAVVGTTIVIIVLIISWIIAGVQTAISEVADFLQGIWNQLNPIFQQVIDFFKNLLEGIELPVIPTPSGSETPPVPGATPPAPTITITSKPTIELPDGGNLTIGELAVIANTRGDRLMCRATPGTNSNIIARLIEGTEVIIRDGPVNQESFNWWQVEPPNENLCWAAGNWLYPLGFTTPSITPTPQSPPIPIPGATPIPTPTPFLEPIPFPTPTPPLAPTRTPGPPPNAKLPVIEKPILVKVFEGYELHWGCINLEDNPLGYYKKYTYYSGWWYVDTDGVTYYGWFNDFEKGAVIGPYDIEWKQTFIVCGIE